MQQGLFAPEHEPDAVYSTDDRYTPPEILERVDVLCPDGLDLDPFWSPLSLVKARHTIACDPTHPDHGGFAAAWSGSVLVNGPWSRPLDVMRKVVASKWSAKMVVICKLDTSTQWWRQYVWPFAQQVCFAGRVRFLRQDGSRMGTPSFETVILNYGHDRCDFDAAFSCLGKVVDL